MNEEFHNHDQGHHDQGFENHDQQNHDQNFEQPVEHGEGEHQEPKRRLGRGINVLLGAGSRINQVDNPEAFGDQDLLQINVELIDRNPFQPRQEFEKTALDELVSSIKKHGVIQPLAVRRCGDRYQLIAGERRLLASKQAGLESVPCQVREMDDKQTCEVAIEENMKRKDLNVLEKAEAFQKYIQEFNTNVEELANQLSLNRSTVTNYLRLLELPEPVKQALLADQITNGHARALLSLSEPFQISLCDRIQKESLSVRKTEELVRSILNPKPEPDTIPISGKKAGKKNEPEVSNHILDMQQQLQDKFGTKVEIKLKTESSGQIVIHFESNDQFDGLFHQIRNAA